MNDESGWEEYLQKSITGVKDWNEYLESLKKIHGNDMLENLIIKDPLLSDPITTGM